MYIRHFQQIGLNTAKFEEKRFRFKRDVFSPQSLSSMLQLPYSSTPATLSLSHHENKMKLRQDSPVFTILIISTKAAGRT